MGVEFKVEVLDSYGENPEIVDVHHFSNLDEADGFANRHDGPCRVAKVIAGDLYHYRRFGVWTME